MKPTDEELAKRIKSVFEDYNDGLSNQGWEELRKKYPEKENRKFPIWWLTGIAATLLMALGLYFNHTLDTQKVVLHVKQQNKGNSKSSTNANEQPVSTNHQEITKNNPHEEFTSVVRTPIEKERYAAQKIHLVHTNTMVKKQSLGSHTLDIKEVENISTPINNNHIAVANVQAEPKTENRVSQQVVADVDVPTKPTKLSTEDFLNEQTKILAATTNKPHKNNGSVASIDIFTGTFFNYQDHNEAKLSAGLGINANLKLSKNVVLSLGAGISQNKASYQSQVPVSVTNSFMSMSSAKESSYNYPSTNQILAATATNAVSFNAQLLSIDLPMVVKFYPTKKQDFYISTGINSSSYLSQKYTYNYSLSNFAIQNGMAQPKEQVEKSKFKGFDFANSAIIAIGINQNIGKNTLIFEPYYKPAINTMGDMNLKINSAGLNLKFNFNSSAKNP
jgi:cytoskeletal protein RodZ